MLGEERKKETLESAIELVPRGKKKGVGPDFVLTAFRCASRGGPRQPDSTSIARCIALNSKQFDHGGSLRETCQFPWLLQGFFPLFIRYTKDNAAVPLRTAIALKTQQNSGPTRCISVSEGHSKKMLPTRNS